MNDSSIVKRTLQNDFTKKRKRGRPPKRWKDQIKEDTGLDFDTLHDIANDRAEWRRHVNQIWAKSQH